jgi:hypothetical protein
MVFYKRKITVADGEITNAAHLTLKQTILPNCLGTSASIHPHWASIHLPKKMS